MRALRVLPAHRDDKSIRSANALRRIRDATGTASGFAASGPLIPFGPFEAELKLVAQS